MDKLQKLEKILELANQDYTTPEEVGEVFETILKILSEINDKFEEKISGNSNQLSNFREELQEKIDLLEIYIKKIINSNRDSITNELNTFKEQLETLVNDFKALREEIPAEFNPSQLEARINEVEAKIPEKTDLEPVTKDIKTLQEELDKANKEIEELKKRPTVVQGGGGTSALGVARAFKYIAHTEQPTGVIDGANTTYRVTKAQTIWWIAGFTLNGEQIAELPNFTYSGNTITFSSPIPAAFSGKDWEIKYIGS